MKLQKLLNGRSPEGPRPLDGMVPVGASLAAAPKSQGRVADDQKQRIQHPTQYDVLFGRGKPYQGHAGNIRLHKVVDLYKSRYSQARRHEKTEIAEEIVQFIKNGGTKAGRFLKRIDGEESWAEVSDSIARDKVSHALRGKPRKDDSSAKSHAVVAGLNGAKRATETDASTASNKRQKVSASSPAPSAELELLAAQRNNGMVAPLQASTNFLPPAVTSGGIPIDLRAQLMSSLAAERQGLSLGGPLGGLQGLLGHPHALQNPLLSNQQILNPLLQSLRVDQNQMRGDPRLWF